MTQPAVNYRHQYMSGVVAVASYPAACLAFVTNRGEVAGTAKARIWREPGRNLVYELEDVAYPGSVWLAQTVLPEHANPVGPDLFWVEIWTTSPDLTPSCAFRDAVLDDTPERDINKMFAYFAPGDFAHFALPFRPLPPEPPVQPPLVG